MDKETVLRYGPVAVVVITIIFQWNLFVKPVDLEKNHREVLQYVSEKYASKEDITDMRKKLDKIYDIIVLRGKIE